jgi:hypothetical protein
MLQEIIRKERQETLAEERQDLENEHDSVKKIRACPYYSPFKASCVNPDHPGRDEEYPNKYPRCNLRGKYSECKIVDKVIELTLDENNSVIHREYLYIKGRANLAEIKDAISQES